MNASVSRWIDLEVGHDDLRAGEEGVAVGMLEGLGVVCVAELK